MYYTPPQFYTVNLKHSSCKYVLSIRVENRWFRSLFCYAGLSALSSFAIILMSMREQVALIVFLMSCDCMGSVALLHGALDWSAVCDCGIS